jgi:hypothetical protein
MATATWIDGAGNWTITADWRTGCPTGSGDGAVIAFGTVSVTMPSPQFDRAQHQQRDIAGRG